jgi:broad specificity phosphatase PhoE
MVKIERVLLVRHGQTDWNVQGRWQGFEAVPLNSDGWGQARALGRYLSGRPVSAIFSSDLPRAWQTATAIGEAVGVEPQPEPLWREFNLGIFQGYTRDESAITYPAEWQAFQADYWDYRIPNGESRRELQARSYRAWERLLAAKAGPEVVVVSHGGTLKMLLLRLFPDYPNLQSVSIANTSLTIVEGGGGHWELAAVSTTPHLL